MSKHETRNSETLPEVHKTKTANKSIMKATLHCPICSKPAQKYATTYYCEECNVDFDENKRLIV